MMNDYLFNQPEKRRIFLLIVLTFVVIVHGLFVVQYVGQSSVLTKIPSSENFHSFITSVDSAETQIDLSPVAPKEHEHSKHGEFKDRDTKKIISRPAQDPAVRSQNKAKTDSKIKTGNAANESLFSNQLSTLPINSKPVQLLHPRFIGERPVPAYPDQALKAKQQGYVLVRILINSQGHVTQAEIRQSSGSNWLDHAAKSAAMRARFHPYLQDGIAINAQADLPFHFVLKK